MSQKTGYYIAIFVGGTVGGYIPTLWGASWFSFSSILFSGIGGILAIAIMFKIFNPKV